MALSSGSGTISAGTYRALLPRRRLSASKPRAPSSSIQGAIDQSASGAAKLSAGSAGLRSRSPFDRRRSRWGQLRRRQCVDRAGQLAAGVGDLAAGLKSGAEKVPSGDAGIAATTAKVAADPVGLTVVRDHEVSNIGQVAAIFFAPLGFGLGRSPSSSCCDRSLGRLCSPLRRAGVWSGRVSAERRPSQWRRHCC